MRVLITYNTPHGGRFDPSGATTEVPGLPPLPDRVGAPPVGGFQPYSALAQEVSAAAGVYNDPREVCTQRPAFPRAPAPAGGAPSPRAPRGR